MKWLPLVVLCAFSVSMQAESPILEESSVSSMSSLHFESTSNENPSLEEELTLLDEELDEEMSIATVEEEKSEELVFEPKEVEMRIPSIDLAAPFENEQEDISLQIIEENTHAQTAHVRPAEAPAPVQTLLRESEQRTLEAEIPAVLTMESSAMDLKHHFEVQLDLQKAFSGSPLIYSLLLIMSLFAVFIWLYSILSLKKVVNLPNQFLGKLHNTLSGNHFDEALSLCHTQNALVCKMIASGIQSRKYGLAAMIESMKAEGKRSSINYWQKIGLLNDIAILAPMLGLLGTVLGMFYAFYDVNRSIESITSLFDGLGVSVGTTVAGLIVAILALILHSTAKYRLIRALSQVESEAHSIASLIDNHTSLYGESK